MEWLDSLDSPACLPCIAARLALLRHQGPSFFVGHTKFDWTGISPESTGAVGDASDAPSDCGCVE
jgi:hypothetical protein